jgi:hypothetical protein
MLLERKGDDFHFGLIGHYVPHPIIRPCGLGKVADELEAVCPFDNIPSAIEIWEIRKISFSLDLKCRFATGDEHAQDHCGQYSRCHHLQKSSTMILPS